MTYEQHPLSAAFPSMAEEDYVALKDSIEAIGVQNPITLYEGAVIDGWHRYLAATELGMPCPTQDLGDVDPRDFVKAQNKARRHLTAGQWALIEVALWNWYSHGSRTSSAPGAELAKQKTASELAELAGVSTRTIEQAKAIETAGVDAVKEAAKAGEVSVKRAAEIAKLPKEDQATALQQPREKRRAPPQAPAEPTEAEQNAAEAHADVSDAELLSDIQKELEAAQKTIAAAQADDLKAEAMKWQRISEIATRRQNELMVRVNEREAELTRMMNWLRRIGRALGEEDPSRIRAAVEAHFRRQVAA